MKGFEQHIVTDFHVNTYETRVFLKLVVAIILLFVGGLIYVIFRSDNLLMFYWFRDLGLDGIVIKLKEEYGQMNIWYWVRYNMPAGLWLLSYMFIIDSIWDDGNGYAYKYFITILPITAIFSEAIQFFHLLPGTFDILDIISYVFAILFFITLKISNI